MVAVNEIPPEVAVEPHPTCERCGRRTAFGKPIPVGLHSGGVTLVCHACRDALEDRKQGRELPQHPLFRYAAVLWKEAGEASEEYWKPRGPNRDLPPYMTRLKTTLNRIARECGLEPKKRPR